MSARLWRSKSTVSQGRIGSWPGQGLHVEPGGGLPLLVGSGSPVPNAGSSMAPAAILLRSARLFVHF